MTKYQVPTVGGIRKVIKQPTAQAAGTTIAEVGSGTISLAQLAQYISQLQDAQQNNTIGAGGNINISTGPGLAGGGSVGNIRISLVAPIPYFGGEDGADGADGPPGAAGPKGATGNTGATGPAGVGVMGPPGDDGINGEDGPPGARGNTGATGATGPTGPAGVGVQGQTGEDGADGDPGPPGAAGPQGAQGNPGPTGGTGPAGPALFMLADDGADGDMGPPGPMGASGGGTGTIEPFNVSPDTHPVTPTGVGLGPNDEFEGATLDTAGTRYSGANAWSWGNQAGTTATQTLGAVALVPPVNDSNLHTIEQTLTTATTWRFRTKLSFLNYGHYNTAGLVLRESSSSKLMRFVLVNSVTISDYQVDNFTNYTTYSSTLVNGSTGAPSAVFSGPVNDIAPLYLELENTGTNYVFRISLTGYDSHFTQVYSGSITQFFTAGADHIGLLALSQNATYAPVPSFDWFRQMA